MTFWHKAATDLLAELQTSADGLAGSEAGRRLARYGPNTLRARERIPDWRLLVATGLVVAAVMAIPFTPVAGPLGLAPIPAVFFAALAGVLALYVLTAEVAKWLFYRVHERVRATGSQPAR